MYKDKQEFLDSPISECEELSDKVKNNCQGIVYHFSEVVGKTAKQLGAMGLKRKTIAELRVVLNKYIYEKF